MRRRRGELSPLRFFDPVAVLDVPLEHAPVAHDSVASGTPSTGSTLVTTAAGASIGIWEMSVGGMFDTEVDEVFIVMSGHATVALLDETPQRAIHLHPGSLCALRAGMRTRWDVTETLRKVYVLGSPATEPEGA